MFCRITMCRHSQKAAARSNQTNPAKTRPYPSTTPQNTPFAVPKDGPENTLKQRMLALGSGDWFAPHVRGDVAEVARMREGRDVVLHDIGHGECRLCWRARRR